MAVHSPAVPRLTGDLDEWDDEANEAIELDGVVAQDVDFAKATRLSVDGSRLDGVGMTAAVLDKLEMTDSECMRLESAGIQTHKANMLRVRMTDSRLTGAEFAEAKFEDCVFQNVKFDDAGFRFASFTRVRFENCILRQADFSNAKFSHVTLTGCELEGANFVSANCKDLDVTTEDLTLAKGLLGLKGATISETQLMQIAPLLASELGFQIAD